MHGYHTEQTARGPVLRVTPQAGDYDALPGVLCPLITIGTAATGWFLSIIAAIGVPSLTKGATITYGVGRVLSICCCGLFTKCTEKSGDFFKLKSHWLGVSACGELLPGFVLMCVGAANNNADTLAPGLVMLSSFVLQGVSYYLCRNYSPEREEEKRSFINTF